MVLMEEQLVYYQQMLLIVLDGIIYVELGMVL